MKVLVIGSGGREHALFWRLAQAASVSRVFAAPGNPGVAQAGGTCLPIKSLAPGELLAAARDIGADLTVVGPEAPLVAGVVDAFRAAGLPIVGPTRANAQLEGSKIFAKRFFAAHGIPTANFQVTATPREAAEVLRRMTYPVVVKADGLAAGKGVIIARDRLEAEAAVGTLGPHLVFEELLTGEEVSFIALCDGRDVLPLEPCQDHKRVFEGDQGPNTGGMGAYCDARILDARQREQILDRFIRPTVAATGFTGFLFAGLMMTASGPQLLEYNVRLGDPETQAILHRWDGDFGHILRAAATGNLRDARAAWRPEPSVCVVLASAGYPGPHRSGDPITGIADAEAAGATVFQAGTRVGAQGLETAGGRVLGVTARGKTLGQAMDAANQAAARVHFAGMQYRRDIGRKGLSRYNETIPGT